MPVPMVVSRRDMEERLLARLLLSGGYGPGSMPVRVVGWCVCSIESGPCERVESLQMSGRF